MKSNKVQAAIAAECDSLKSMLLAKNKAYGNSALDPLRIFSKADTDEQINVRLDDKLSRIKRGSAAGEDVVRDLVGYFVLKLVHRRLNGEPHEGKRVRRAVSKRTKSSPRGRRR